MNSTTKNWLSLRANLSVFAILFIGISIITSNHTQAQDLWNSSMNPSDSTNFTWSPNPVSIGGDSITSQVGLQVTSNQGRILANGLYFYDSKIFRPDGLPVARLEQKFGMRFNSYYSKWVFSTNTALLVGYHPNGQSFGFGDLLVEGNTGLGTTLPNAKLDVHGNFDLNGNEFYLYGNPQIPEKMDSTEDAPLDAFRMYRHRSLSKDGTEQNSIFFEKTNSSEKNGAIIFGNKMDGIMKPALTIFDNGHVGIGTMYPTATLTINGGVTSEELEIIEDVPEADYVFEDDYNLRSLEEVETYIQENKHLPDVPSAQEFKENGYKVGEMDNLLLQKVEELTLYLIQMKKDNQTLQAQIESLTKQLEELKAQK